MKLAIVTTSYPAYLKDFYNKNSGLAQRSFADQKAALDYDGFGWADFWSRALRPYGYEAKEFPINNEPLQRAWALENGLANPASIDLHEIALRQIETFKPEILWYDHHDDMLLEKIRFHAPSNRLVLGWVGSAIPGNNAFQFIDLILSCAPESVRRLQAAGFRSLHLNHAFESKILDRLKRREKEIDCSFIGQIVPYQEFHSQREQILQELSAKIKVEIFSPSGNLGWKEEAKATGRLFLHDLVKLARNIGVPESVLGGLPVISRAAKWPSRPVKPVTSKLKHILKPAVFGLEMYETLQASRVSLNIHADSSPTHASNMRLFETTGVGTCLVTDWKDNLPELFEPDREVVTYRSAAECAEKIKWLLDHPTEREAIAKAGKDRTMIDHSFLKRAKQLDEIIKQSL